MLIYARRALAIFFLLFAANTQASTWLLRIDHNSPFAAAIFSEPIFNFSNGDALYSLPPEQLSNINLPQLFTSPGFRYLEPSNELDAPQPITRITARAASDERQDFLQQDGFSQLDSWQRDCTNISIAVIDSGVDMAHPQLQNTFFVSPLDARLTDNPLTDEYGHGTHVAGLLAAQQSSDNSVQGACVGATLMPIRFLDRYGAGSVSDAITGIRWAIDNHAQVINHSWTVKAYSQALFDVIQAADELGIVQVTAAGNIGSNNDQFALYPAAFSTLFSGVLSVANWDNSRQTLFSSSNYGLTGVDLAASGTNLLSLAPDNASQVRTGSSMAAPLVSATAAMLKQQDPDLTAAQVRSVLQLSTQQEPQLSASIRSAGRLNAASALEQDTSLANILFARADSNVITLNGVGFMGDDEWRFLSATLPAKTYSLAALTFSETQVSFQGQELANGYWQLYRNGERLSQLAYQPTLAAPSELQAIANESGQLISWRGSAAAEKYQIQAAIDDQGFITIAELAAPANQLQHNITNYNSIRYRIRASYDYQFNGAQINTKYSAYNEPLILTNEAQVAASSSPIWQSELIASVPQGAQAVIALQVSGTEQGGFFELLEDPEQLVLDLSSEGILQLDTTLALSSEVTVAYNYNNRQSIKQIALSVHAQSNWLMATENDEKLTLVSNDFMVHSWQKRIDGKYQIDGVSTGEQALLALSLDSLGRKFAAVKVYDNGELLSAAQLMVNEQQINISLPLVNNDSLSSKRVLVELSLRDKSQSTDSRCFIASSLYPQQPDKLHKLRLFRDQVLLKIPGGETIVAAYYHYSPLLVEKLKEAPRVKRLLTSTLDFFL